MSNNKKSMCIWVSICVCLILSSPENWKDLKTLRFRTLLALGVALPSMKYGLDAFSSVHIIFKLYFSFFTQLCFPSFKAVKPNLSLFFSALSPQRERLSYCLTCGNFLLSHFAFLPHNKQLCITGNHP